MQSEEHVPKELEGILQSFAGRVERLAEQAERKAADCYQNNRKDIKGFLNCTEPLLEKTQKLGSRMETALAFSTYLFQQCMASGKSNSDCAIQLHSVMDSIDSDIQSILK